jgi:hypothetical protein
MKNDTDVGHVPQQGEGTINGMFLSRSFVKVSSKRAPGAFVILCLLATLITACAGSSSTTSSSKSGKNTQVLPTNNGMITYSSRPSDAIVRTFYGGGNLGTLAFSPEISIYGDGTYILGPGIQMRQGKLDADSFQQLLHTLVDTDGLLSFTQTQFYDVPDQNATFLQLILNNKHYEFQYGKFGTLQESAQELDEYHRLDRALTTIRESIKGPTHPYRNNTMIVLVHQDFSPDLTQNIPEWSLPDFTLNQLAIFECGVILPDQVGPNGDTGCLTFTAPGVAYLPTTRQLQSIRALLKNQQEGEFIEQGLYYHLVLRPLLPDELPQKLVAMLGSNELSYNGIPLRSGAVPKPKPTP